MTPGADTTVPDMPAVDAPAVGQASSDSALGHEAEDRHCSFTREQWAKLRDATPLSVTEAELEALAGLVEPVTLDMVRDIYLPLSRLLNLRFGAKRQLRAATERFFGRVLPPRPYLIGIGGSVSAGKSTTARILRAVLASWPDHPEVDLITTDGFLLPNAELTARGLLGRKGFPESYRRGELREFLQRISSGDPDVAAPVYSHNLYDVTDEVQIVNQPDILIVEGLNVLQTGPPSSTPFVSDFFDFTIYVDADAADLEEWYVERFQQLRKTVFREQTAYFAQFAELPASAADAVARTIWRSINLVNLQENILPTRARADLVLAKGRNHAVDHVELRYH
ncbi:type I pantothenate kinase [Candidatus Poriferisodalis sp.]|uniref:type I pantothenate kinase n=1 Tax=Candidatus Poriferisodalis sp. TaxID=3101277 RepID=UPI003B021002